MPKREVVWLIIRLIGVYFAYCAIVSIFSLASAVATLYSASGSDDATSNSNTAISAPGFPGMQQSPNSSAKPADTAAEKAQKDALKGFLFYLFVTGLYGAAAFYLLKRGQFLFHLLNSENFPTRTTTKEPPVTTLRL